MRVFTFIGEKLLNVAQGLGEMLALLCETVYYFKEAPRNLTSIFRQISVIGIGTLPIAMLVALFVGMVLSLQAINALEQFGASDQVSLLVGKSLFRELGPVLTALLFAGRAGTALASEIGLMKATDQLSAMEMMAVDPIRRVVLPRFLGGVIAMPLLTELAHAVHGDAMPDVMFVLDVPPDVASQPARRPVGPARRLRRHRRGHRRSGPYIGYLLDQTDQAPFGDL